MSSVQYEPGCESRYPHAPDVLERTYADGGFSRGWSMHAKPVPRYFFDVHVHYAGPKGAKVTDAIAPEAEIAAEMSIRRALMLIRVYGKGWKPTDRQIEEEAYLPMEDFARITQGLARADRYHWAPSILYRSPEPDLVHAAADAGACCIKMLNIPIIKEAAPHDVWLSPEWSATFEAMAQRGLPLLWHVTQRLPSSEYTGGGRNTYWTDGWRNGAGYTNEDLLQVFLTCCTRHPGVRFIGAHQLHIGWERLDQLFTAHQNLYVDSTIGCQLQLYDDFYPQDKDFLRAVFIRWADRILFGTDSFWGRPGRTADTEIYRQHMRFILKLDLPQDVVDKVTHGNAERLFGSAPLA